MRVDPIRLDEAQRRERTRPGYVGRLREWQVARDRVVKQTGKCIITIYSQSYWASHNDYLGPRLAKDMTTAYGDAGIGWVGARNKSPRTDEVAVTMTGTWTRRGPSVSPDTTHMSTDEAGATIKVSVSNQQPVPAVHDGATLLWLNEVGGQARYRWTDNGTPGSWSDIDLSTGVGLQVMSLPGIPSGTVFDLEVECVSGRIDIAGFNFVSSTAKGIVVNNASQSATAARDFAATDQTQRKVGIGELGGDLVILHQMGNDLNLHRAIKYKEYQRVMIETVHQQLPMADILLIATQEWGHRNALQRMGDYSDALRELQAEYSQYCSLVDLQPFWGEYGYDDTWVYLRSFGAAHPDTTRGVPLMLNAIYDFIDPSIRPILLLKARGLV